jgi:two-component sensor histidine kinase
VKNNLQIVSSLLNIQARSVQDEKARKSIKEGKLRIEAMSIIHQRLYMNEDITELNMLEYVEDLVAHLARSYGYTADTYTLHLSIKPLCCDIDNAVPIGLMLNEVLTNAFKYAFPNNPAPMLWVTIENEKGLKIQVRDNGLQVPNVSPQGTGFGTKLIQSLSSDLNATTTVEYNNGYSFNLTANAGSR